MTSQQAWRTNQPRSQMGTTKHPMGRPATGASLKDVNPGFTVLARVRPTGCPKCHGKQWLRRSRKWRKCWTCGTDYDGTDIPMPVGYWGAIRAELEAKVRLLNPGMI